MRADSSSVSPFDPALSALGRDVTLTRRSSLLGWASSAALHAALFGLLYLLGQAPDYGFEFDVPVELELGMTEAVAVEAPAVAAPASDGADEEPPASAAPSEADATPAVTDAEASAEPPSEPRPRRRRRRERSNSPEGDAEAPPDATAPPVAFLPAGGQVALRLDLDLVRDSQVRADAEALLAVVPDWQILLGESGIDPIRDLSRVLVATPNFQRRSLVVAGRVVPGTVEPSEVIARANGRSEDELEWEEQDGVPTAAWPSADGTERRVAILGERHFVVARPEDMIRVVAIANVRAERSDDAPADALVALPEGAAITVEVEGARSYLRQSPCPVPTRLSARVDPHPLDVGAALHGSYDSEAQATEAKQCFESLRARVVRNPFVSFSGMGPALTGLRFEVEGASLDATTTLSYGQVRTLLRYVRGMFDRPRASPPPVTPIPPPVTPGAPVPPPVTPVPPPVPPPVTPVPPPPPAR